MPELPREQQGRQLLRVDGRRHSHNIVAPDFGYVAETHMTGPQQAPGSSYPAASLHCSSCHDPHGKYRRMSTTGGQGAYTTTGAPIYTSGSYGAEPTATYAVGAYRLLGGSLQADVRHDGQPRSSSSRRARTTTRPSRRTRTSTARTSRARRARAT